MQQGTVKFFNDEKGFGFIKDNETDQDYFVHVSGVTEEIADGDAVEYEVVEAKKGLNAKKEKKV